MKTQLLTGALALLTSVALAQDPDVVFPSDHMSGDPLMPVLEGASYQTWFPFSDGISHHMAVYERWDLGVPNGKQITHIGFKQDGTRASTGYAVRLEVIMGYTQRGYDNLETTFADNYIAGTDVQVVPPMNLTLPNLVSGGASAFIWLPLTTPFTMTGSDNLLVEFKIYFNSNGNSSWSYRLDRARFMSEVKTIGLGCPTSGGTTPTLTSYATKVGGNWQVGLSGAPANSLVLLGYNIDQNLLPPYQVKIPGVITLPASCPGYLDLDPAKLSYDIQITNSSGSYWWYFKVPNELIYNDTVVGSQVFCWDWFLPAGGVMSNGDEVTFGVEPRVSILRSSGDVNSTSGSLYKEYGVITLFRHN